MTYTGKDEVIGNLFTALNTHISTYGSLSTKLASADGDLEKALSAFMETSDNPEAVKLRKAIETANARLRKVAEDNVSVEKMSDEEKANTKVQLSELKTKISKTKDAIETVAPLRDGTDEILAALSEVSDPTKSGRGRPRGSAGSSTPRPRVNLVVVSSAAPDKPQKFDSFSKAVAVLNTDVASLQAEYAKAAGVSPEDVSKVKKDIEFSFTPPGSETPWTVKVSPKAA